VSEVLNLHAKIGFHELVSRHRVADVKAQLLDPAADRFTIEGIGAAAGFGSRSAMYAAFRRIEGMTPTEFRVRARARSTAAKMG
jgi:methylphosphotriester-DNA--protein-cysteine methyltransferase